MYVDILILSALQDYPSYGYELKRQVEYLLVDSSLKDSQLYPALRRFEEQGAVTRTIQRQSGRPDRHIYALTQQGHDLLARLLRTFPLELAHNEREFLTRVANFHQLTVEERRAILTTRQTALRPYVERFEQWQAQVQGQEQPEQFYGQQILAFQLQRLRQELEWIAQLAEEEHA
jgi:DNA-binding PadR family transcriptional regulator